MKELFATYGALENREGLKRKIDLQFFADGGADGTGGEPGDDSTKDPEEGGKDPEVTLPKTAEELQKLLQSDIISLEKSKYLCYNTVWMAQYPSQYLHLQGGAKNPSWAISMMSLLVAADAQLGVAIRVKRAGRSAMACRR